MYTTLGELIRPPAPHLPDRGRFATACQNALSAAFHFAAAIVIVAVLKPSSASSPAGARPPAAPLEVTHLVFVAPLGRQQGGGGGGGGNRQREPIRRAEAVGRDAATLRVVKPQPKANPLMEADVPVVTVPGVLLDATPLAFGTRDVIGLPDGVSFGASTGPGSGGGMGDGVGTGIGSGSRPGLGPGEGGGTGGGIYRPGGSVTAPLVRRQVKPKYTDDALRQRIQGSVLLELVVKSDGRPANIRVVRSLDPGGLDDRAVLAARQWEFEAGRLGVVPVDVLVTLMLDFRIQ
jgi:periplasmic protein TonB